MDRRLLWVRTYEWPNSPDGTGVSWLAYRDEWSGVARGYVDGEEKTTIDNYLAPAGQRVAYSIGGLPSGPTRSPSKPPARTIKARRDRGCGSTPLTLASSR